MFPYKYLLSFFICFFALLIKSFTSYSLEILCSSFYIGIFLLKNKYSFVFFLMLIFLKGMFVSVDIFLDLSMLFLAAFLLSSFQEVLFSEKPWFDYLSFVIFFTFYKVSWLIFFKKTPFNVTYMETFFLDLFINIILYVILKTLWKEEELYGEF